MGTASLDQSIDRLYAAFADVRKPLRIEGCSHCLAEKDIEILLTSPLRDITPGDLSPYASSAFLTVGEEADYVYFLPRILEISATEESWWPDPEVTGRAMRTANPSSWPVHRVEAVQNFNTAVVHSAIVFGTYYKLDSWLCAIARMGFSVRPHLSQISECPAAVLEYFEDNSQCLPQGRLCNAFWELPCAEHDTIVEWFYSEEIRKVPFEAYGYILERSN